jgi:arylsulfatase A-like enzyme
MIAMNTPRTLSSKRTFECRAASIHLGHWLQSFWRVVIAFALLVHANAANPTSKPNIVYVICDQWRASAMGYAGDPNVKTPNLDRLAGSGFNFVNAVSVCPVCTPYRAALMTGRYPTSTGMFLNDAHLPDSELCLAQVLKSAGYATGFIGKWHLDGNGRAAYIPPERRRGWDYWKAGECDHNYNHSHYYTGASDVKQFWPGYDAFAQTVDAQQYIRDHAPGPQPFVLMVSYGPPHFPFNTAPKEFAALYPPESIQLLPGVPPAMQELAKKDCQGYYAHCTALDKCIGDLRQTLEETGIAQNTIFVVTSDHGEMMGSQGAPPTMKQVAWTQSANVPFLLAYPALTAGDQGRTVRTPLTTPDIFPTLLGLAGVPAPGTVEGEDLSPLLRGGREADRAALYMSVSPFAGPGFNKEYRAIRTDRYTYVRSLEGPWLLYDDVKDPNQLDNLVGHAESADLLAKLDARLHAQLQRVGDDFRPARAYLEEWSYPLEPGQSLPYLSGKGAGFAPHRKPAPAPDPKL